MGQRRRRHHLHGGVLTKRVAIVTTGHDVADARLHRTAGALQRAGFEVSVLGLGDPAGAPPGCDVVTAPRSGQLGRLFRALSWPWRAGADVIFTIDPDTALSALLASRFRRIRWVADVHEDYRALLRDRAWVPAPIRGLLGGLVGLLNRLLAQADLVVVADEHLPPDTARQRRVMRNEPDFSLLPPLTDRPSASGSMRAVYVGDNRRSRGLRTMVEAVAATAGDEMPWRLDLVGPVAAEDQAWLDQRLSLDDARLIRCHGRLDPRTSWEVARGAAVGFCLLESTPAFVAAMPSKIYEYLACGMPVVATPLPRVAELLGRSEAGVVVDDAQGAAEALRRFASDEAWRELLVAAARRTAVEARSQPNTYDQTAQTIGQFLRSDGAAK